jgi:hypothetical protein
MEKLSKEEYLYRLEYYHGEDVSWHRKNNSDVDTLREELLDLGDEEFLDLGDEEFLDL